MIESNRNIMGCILSPYDARDIAYAIHPARQGEEVTIPETFSLREKQTSVKSQGGCGSCTAFATIASYESLGEGTEDMSEGDLYCRRANSPSAGMSIRDALQLFMNEGVCHEGCYPYTGNPKNTCAGRLCDAHIAQRMDHKIASYHRVYSPIEEVLFRGETPVIAAVPVYDCWGSVGSDGVIPMPHGSMRGYHAIEIIGYDKKAGYYPFKNSWGPLWGHAGIGLLPMAYPIPEAWSMKRVTTPPVASIQILSTSIGTPSIFGWPVTFVLDTTTACSMHIYVNGTRTWFARRLRAGRNTVRENLRCGVGETPVRLEFRTKEAGVIKAFDGVFTNNPTILFP